MEIPRREITGIAVPKFTRKAPANIAGVYRNPKSNNTARAKPAGGQIGETLCFTKDRERPNFPKIKYAATMIRNLRV